MTLKFRIVSRIDIRRDKAVQCRRFDGSRPIGDPVDLARRYEDDGADELLINDCMASLYGRSQIEVIVDAISTSVMIPVTIAGGLRDHEDISRAFAAGADKVAIGTSVNEKPTLLGEWSRKWGAQALVLKMDVRAHNHVIAGGRLPTGRIPKHWAAECVRRGAGEVLYTAVDQDGTLEGPDMCFPAATQGLPVPVLYAGGIRYAGDVLNIASHCNGVVINRALHEGVINIRELKNFLNTEGVPVRCL